MDAKRLNEIISNGIERFINEELSISKALETAVNNAEKEILYKFSSKESVRIIKDSVNVDGERFTIQNVYLLTSLYFGENALIPCTVHIIDFPTENVYDNVWDCYSLNGNYNKAENRIYVAVNAIAGQVNKMLLRNLLFHEGEHAYQYLMTVNKTKNSNIYNKAAKIVKGKDKEHSIPEFIAIASLLYYYNKLELDAKVNELYGELTENGLNIKNTNFYNDKSYYDEIRSNVLSVIDDGVYDFALKYFGITKESLLRTIENGEKYLIKKIRKCYQRAYNEMKVNESRKKRNIETILNKVKPIPLKYN